MRYRGANVVPSVTVKDLELLQSYGANLIRYQVAPYHPTTPEDWLEQCKWQTQHLRELFDGGEFDQLKIIVELHKLSPGGLEATLDGWNEILVQCGDLPQIIGYGLINEPEGNNATVREMQLRIIEELAKAGVSSAMKRVITDPYSDPLKFTGMDAYKSVRNPWYEAHMYLPMAFTHQGVYQYPMGKKYPTARVNKAKLKTFLAPVRLFQLQHKVKIFIGEFMVSSFADEDSRVNYLRDVIDICEEYGWHWASLSFGEEVPWQVTGKVLELLKSKWALNGN